MRRQRRGVVAKAERVLASAARPLRHDPEPLTKPPQWRTSAEREKYAYDYLRKSLRLAPAAAAALVGNLAYESTKFLPPRKNPPELVPWLREIRTGSGRRGIGIAMWTQKERTEAFLSFADQDKLGRPWTDLGLQLDYVVHELKTENQLYRTRDGREVYLLSDRHILEELRRIHGSMAADLMVATQLVEANYLSPEPGSLSARYGEARDVLTGRYG